jgi:tetratricopeptide (TPR) repeat protein
MDGVGDVLRELRARAEAYPRGRYPIQHATAQFHLGTALAGSGRLREAEAALRTATELFEPDKLPLEHAKALVSLGAVARQLGDDERALALFQRAGDIFERNDASLEQGAALFNAGLVYRDRGDERGALAPLRRARALLDGTRVPGHASAVARELGIALLRGGREDEGRAALAEAVTLARRVGDLPALGAAANALGLALLAAGRADDAVASLLDALGAHPRTVRPVEWAMVKANLALAYERRREPARARLSARQALSVGAGATAVVDQAEGVLKRLGDRPGEVGAVVLEEPPEAWGAVLREELARWLVEPPETRAAEARAWVDTLLEQSDPALAEAWLSVLLELSPEQAEASAKDALTALAGTSAAEAERFRSLVASALVRFHVPQWQRLAHMFDTLASELDLDVRWS